MMKLSAVVNAFLLYLQHNNEHYGNNRYPSIWLETQANEFKYAMTYAENTLSDLESTDDYIDYLKTIHKNCAQKTYSIILDAGQSTLIQQEKAGYYRKDESFSMKTPPLFNTTNIKSLDFFRSGRMPAILNKRLELLGYNPSEMTLSEKTKAIHGKPAWREANDVIQIAEYIKQFVGIKNCYYFLRAYYKIHFLQTSALDNPKHLLFAAHLVQEIQTIGKSLKLRFDETRLTLNAKEQFAYDMIYITYPNPKQIKKLIANFMSTLGKEIKELDWENKKAVANFCYQSYLRFINIHPFMDANYRTYTIFMNALLSKYGYMYINFHDINLKQILSTQFNQQEPNGTLALTYLESLLQNTLSTEQAPSNRHATSLPVFFKQCGPDDAKNYTCEYSTFKII